jgi:DNA polymerase-3 subunit alpha
MSDQQGAYEVTFFSETLAKAGDHLAEGTALLLTAEARLDGETLRLTAQDVEPLEKAASGVASGIKLWLEQSAAVPNIRTLLEREGKGRGRVVLVPVTGPGQEVEIALPGLFNVSPRLMQAMKVLPGVAEVQEL